MAALSIALPVVFVPAVNLVRAVVSLSGAVSRPASLQSTYVCPGPGSGTSPPSLGAGPELTGEDLAFVLRPLLLRGRGALLCSVCVPATCILGLCVALRPVFSAFTWSWLAAAPFSQLFTFS